MPDDKKRGGRATLALCVAALALSALLVWRYPVYFRADDAYFLEWAAEHDSPLAAFDPARAEIFSTIRPAVNLAWWGMYRLFGLNPLPYHLVLSLLFTFSFVIFYRLVEAAFSRRVAVASLLAYGCAFYYLCSVVFWFSDLTFALETFLLNLALLWLFRGAAGKVRYLAFGAIAWAGAVLTKEPSVIIGPLVLSALLLTRWHRPTTASFRRAAVVAGVMLGVGVLWVVLNPYLHGRQLWAGAGGAESFYPYAAARWRFYAAYLYGQFGVLLWVATFYLVLRRLPPLSRLDDAWKSALPLVGGAALALALRPIPAVALLVLFAAFVPLLLCRDRATPGVVWFAVPILGLTTISFTVRTYLWEASFGAALVMGVAFSEWVDAAAWRRWMRSWPRRAAAAALALGVLVGAGIFCGPLIAGKLEVLRVVSDTRRNFRGAAEYLIRDAGGEDLDLVVVEYEDMGLDYHRDILPLADGPKAHRQKTMTGDELGRFLRVAGKENVRVRDFAWFRRNPAAPNVLIFIMNRGELGYVADTGLRMDVVYSAERGTEGVWLMRPRPPGGSHVSK
ncbi:MAG: glycosyltransferase family 39 protein [Candidatus Zixiibacteriota bacterium]|jgi:hypothetical protein